MIIKIKIHSSFEIEDFVEINLCKLCAILRSRVLLALCPPQGYRSATPLLCNYSVACTRINRVMLVSMCAQTVKDVFEENKI